jgi:hypothetical protein
MAFGLVLAPGLFSGRQAEVRAVPTPKEKITYLDLKSKANHKLKDDFHTTMFPGNNLAELPRGEQKFAGVKFLVGDGLIQLGSTEVKDLPDKVEGIPVGQAFAKLYILHGTGYQADENAVIGSYVVHYADKSREKIDIIYGKDVRDWWDGQDKNEVSRGKLAWQGSNEAVKKRDVKLRLFLATWDNPHPKKKVDRIDFISSRTKAAPFCVAMTVQEK